MPLTEPSQFVDIVERRYFGNMSNSRPELILPLLCEDAVLTGFFGSNAPRVVKHKPAQGEESFARFFGGLQHEFELRYSEFFHVVDVEEQRCACTFRLEIIPRNASAVPTRVLRNCNLFQFENGLIKAVTAYFAHPASDADPWATLRDRPTAAED